MFSPRWCKVLRDLQQNTSQAGLVIGAIALGIFSVAWVSVSYSILSRELHDNYVATNPASAILYTDNASPDMLRAVNELPNIAEAEVAGTLTARVWVEDEWKTLDLFVRQDFVSSRINQITPEDGVYPPPDGEILLERLALSVAGVEIGESIHLQIPGQAPQDIRVAGTVHDVSLSPAWQDSKVYGYLTLKTLNDLGAAPVLNEIRIVVAGDSSDEEHVHQVALQTADWLTAQGQTVYRVQVPPPNEHPLQSQMESILLLLATFGTMAILLSAVLVTNMITAFLSRQIRQIAVMKAIGARRYQVIGMYFGMVALLSGIALLIAFPLGFLAGRLNADFVAYMLNFSIQSYHIPHPVFLLQLLIGLGIPLLAAAYPIYKGTQLTVREALSDYGVSQAAFGERGFDRLLAGLSGLARPLLLSIRNTFRQRGRLLLTFATLAMGGAIFMAALNVRASLLNTIEVRYAGLHYDLSLAFDQPYPIDELEETAVSVPGVQMAEAWGGGSAALVQADGTVGEAFILMAPPPDTTLITPAVTDGQWLSAENGIVLNHNLLAEYPDLQVGDKITLNLNQQPSIWQIVGIVREPVAPPIAYVTYADFTDLSHENAYAQSLYVVTEQHSESNVQVIQQKIEEAFATKGITITSNQTSFTTREIIENHAVLMTSFLLLAAFLSLLVGGLGLMTTMSLNVLERTREIGVMRAIGAPTNALLKIILTEGLLIGLLSWLLAAVIVVPLSYGVANVLGQTLLETALDFVINPASFVIWLGVVVAFSIAAGLPPAWNATRLTVRDVLVYE